MSDWVKEVLDEYREVYKQFMGYSDNDMPSDECLIRIALQWDMDEMKKHLKTA